MWAIKCSYKFSVKQAKNSQNKAAPRRLIMQSRRDFLKLAAMLSGAAGVSGFIPDSIQRAYAIEPESGSTYLDAEHIVILMQENRSFDHTLGTSPGRSRIQ